MNYNSQNIYAVCCITNYALDKDYIEEWCEHYFGIGFNRIYLIDDAKDQKKFLNEIPYIKTCIDSGKIHYIKNFEHPSQQKLYEAFYRKHRGDFLWCGFFDSDEFLTFDKHTAVQDFLNDQNLNFSNADVIQFCWREYGDDGYVHKQNKPVRETFKKVIPLLKTDGTIECKVMIRGGLINVEFTLGHCAVSNKQYSKIKFCDGTTVGKKSPFHKAEYSVAAIEHYATKTIEEYAYRKSFGRLDIPNKNPEECFSEFKHIFFKRNEWTAEKEVVFNDMKHKLFPKKKVIYTVIVNGYDDLKQPKVIDKDYDYICFTNTPEYNDTIWDIYPIPEDIKGKYPKQISIQLKFRPHIYLKNYEESVYLDGNAQITKSISELYKRIGADKYWLSLKKHPSRNCTYEEIDACLKYGLISQEKHDETVKFLQDSNFPKQCGLYETNIIFRRHNEAKCISLMELWLSLFMEKDEKTRGQFYLSYCIWKNNVKDEINVFDYDRAPWFGSNDAYVVFLDHKRKIKIYTTYCREEQEPRIEKNDIVTPYNTNCDEFPTNILNKYWSEYIAIKNIWLKGRDTDYIGFDQYDTHFPYDDVKKLVSLNRVIFYTKMNVTSPYKNFVGCHGEPDIMNAIKILDEKYGKGNKYTDYLYNGKMLYYKSCFVMPWEMFDKMAEFIFGVLDALDAEYNLNFDAEKYKELYQRRVDEGIFRNKARKTFELQRRGFGYLAERLVSAWLWVNIPQENIIFIKNGEYKKALPPPASCNGNETAKTLYVKKKFPINNATEIIKSVYGMY